MQLCKIQWLAFAFAFLSIHYLRTTQQKAKRQTLGIESSASPNYTTARKEWVYRDTGLALNDTKSIRDCSQLLIICTHLVAPMSIRIPSPVLERKWADSLVYHPGTLKGPPLEQTTHLLTHCL